MTRILLRDAWHTAAHVGCRPLNLMRAFGRLYPGLWQSADVERGRHSWPKWCFMPFVEFDSCLRQHFARRGLVPPSDGRFEQEALSGLAISAWRQSKGVYTFDRSLAACLARTEVAALPTDVVVRMPERCVYIAAGQDMPAHGRCPALHAHGFFAQVGLDGPHRVLTLTFDTSTGPILLSIDLAPGADLVEAAVRGIHESERNLADVRQRMIDLLRGALPYVLYLCAEEPDIDGTPRGEPEPTKTRHGPRWFPPEDVAQWNVGVRLGAVLRKAREAEKDEGQAHPHGRPRPHLRRAHFHHYWTGPRSKPTQRRCVLRWVYEALVNARTPDNLVATVRPVAP